LVLQKAKLLAVQRQTSVSGLVTRSLEWLVAQEDLYYIAQQSHLAKLEQGVDLGTHGRIATSRDQLHE